MRHMVTFYSPGTFVSEVSERPIREWSTAEALRIAATIEERYGARPYAFRFSTAETGAKSGMHFINPKIRLLEEIEAAADPAESILVSNMRGNGWPIVAETCTPWRNTAPFEPDAVAVNADGVIVRRGDDADLAGYRARVLAAA